MNLTEAINMAPAYWRGKNPDELIVPPFLADHEIVRNDVLDYAVEIEWFDAQLGKMLSYLESTGELDNTIVVVTSDNGMPFPYAKANLHEMGTHVPLAISGPGVKYGGRVVDDLVSLIDLAPTFLDLAGVGYFDGITGKTLIPVFESDQEGHVDASRKYVLTGRERHTHARPDNLGYPSRALRTKEYLYVKNFKPDRWPAGDPAPETSPPLPSRNYKEIVLGYEDIDDSPTKEFMIEEKEQWPGLFRIGFEKRPESQLFHIASDPWAVADLSENPEYAGKMRKLDKKLMNLLKEQKDPRVLGRGDIFESYPRFGLMRPFPGFSERGAYNPTYMNPDAFNPAFIERGTFDN
jgi:N-sulfoglucosamine sulfohydrolase